jgi:hypothetical protein
MSRLVRCVYCEAEQEQLVREKIGAEVERLGSELDAAGNDRSAIISVYDRVKLLAPRFVDLAVQIKHFSFHEESEWRVLMSAEGDIVKYRDSRGTIIPYILFRPDGGLSIVDLVVGPGPHQDRSLQTARRLMAHYGFANVQPRRSETPFRSW